MGLLFTTIANEILKKQMRLSIYQPEVFEGKELPVLYFLHGRTGNEQLLQKLGVDKIADALINTGKIKPLIIVCPHLDNSRGINSSEVYQELKGKYGIVHRGPYENYLIEEIIPFIDSKWHTIRNRTARYIGGISSGGYCVLSLGFRHQDLFSKIGGHMPAIDLSYADEEECYFDNEAMWLKYDPISIAKRTTFRELCVFLDAGRNDEGKFYRACKKLFLILQQKGVNVQNHLFKGYHDMEYVTFHVKRYLSFYGN